MTEQINRNGLTWYCTICDESVTHQHRPKKPSYEELLNTLREARECLRVGSAAREAIKEMLERAEHGR